MKYVCDVCGWVYDERKGDSELDIESGTLFEELPSDFECPFCYSGKEVFSEVDELGGLKGIVSLRYLCFI